MADAGTATNVEDVGYSYKDAVALGRSLGIPFSEFRSKFNWSMTEWRYFPPDNYERAAPPEQKTSIRKLKRKSDGKAGPSKGVQPTFDLELQAKADLYRNISIALGILCAYLAWQTLGDDVGEYED